jgi:hypothetical protein
VSLLNWDLCSFLRTVIYCYNFSFKHCFSWTPYFLCVVSSFSRALKYTLISFLISFLTHWLFWLITVCLYISPNLFLWIYNLVPLWLGNIVCLILILLNLSWLVLSPKYILPCECTMCFWEEYVHILLLLGRIFYRYVLILIIMLLESATSLLIFCLFILSIARNKILKSPTTTVVYFFFQFYKFLLHMFWGSVTRCVYLMVSW